MLLRTPQRFLAANVTNNRMKKEQIQAIGNFLMYYHEDLNYIKIFQDFKENRISREDYCLKNKGTFYSFLIEFKIIRNFKKGETEQLLKETEYYIKNHNENNVDLFAEKLAKTDLTRGNRTTSAASKILFLNNPWNIIPMDRINRKALKQNENEYSIYKVNLDLFRKTNKSVIEECLFYINPLVTTIENEFKDSLKDINIIRENRLIDKLLWTT